MSFLKTSIALVTFAAAIGSAHAGGLLGDTINMVAPGLGTALDRANGDLGRPVERAIGQGLNYYVPGASVVTDEVWGVGSPPSSR